MKTILMVAAGLILSSNVFAAQRFLYFVATENIDKNIVFNLDMEPLYPFVTGYTKDRGAGQLVCTYKSVAGDLQTFSIGWEECDHSTSMNLQFSHGDVSSEYDSLFVDHKSVMMGGSISGKEGGAVQFGVMSATQYTKIQQASIHDPHPLPSIANVSSAIRNDQEDPSTIAPRSVVCSLSFVQQGCQQ